MKKSDLTKIIAISAVAAAAAGAAVVLYKYHKNKVESEERAARLSDANAYILGGGMSALASALYLTRDCGFTPANVHVLTEGVYDHGNSATGYICRRGKIINEKNSPNFFDLIQEVRSLDISDFTICDEILNMYSARGALRPITFIDNDGNVTDISKIRIDKANRRNIIRLMRENKDILVSVPLSEIFGEDFFGSEFWKLVSATYGFSRSSNAYEFVNAIALMDETLSGTIPSDFDRSEEIIEPLRAHLEELGVDVVSGASVTDIDFEDGHAEAIHYSDNGVRKTVYLNEDDICILPTDELADCETLGSFDESAPREFGAPYALWERLADKHPSFKNPAALFDGSDKNMSEEFTVTLSNHLLPELIDEVTCGALGVDGVIVLDNSSWKITVSAVPPSHFKDLSDETAVLWGTATRFDRNGEYVTKPMTDCSGAEILYELVSCLNLVEAWEDIRETVVNVIPCHRRYDKAYLAPVASKLEIIPTGISNIAVSGDFVSGSGSVFTEEFIVTTAKTAAYRLLGSKKRIYRSGKSSASAVKRALRKQFK